MADVVIDEVAIDIVPELKNFLADMRRQAIPAAERIGREIGDAIGRAISKAVEDSITDGIRRAKARAAGSKVDVKADLDTTEAEKKLERLKRNRSKATVDVDADTGEAAAEIAEVGRAVGRATVKVDADTTAAKVEVERLKRSVNGDNVKLRVNVSGGADRGDGRDARGRFVGNGGGGGGAGSIDQLTGAALNAKGAMYGLAAAGVALGPAIVPAAAVAAAAVVALGAAASVAGAAFGTIALGFSGISDAYSALSNQSKKAGAAAGGVANKQGQIQSALERVESAQRALTNAQADAADAAVRNAERIADAERKVTEAQETEKAAQLALTEARRKAKEDIEDLALSVQEAATAEERAALTLRKAKANLEKVSLDESKTDDERLDAKLAVDEAVEGLERQKLATQRLNTEKAASDKAGVEGAKVVVDAQKNVRDAAQGIADALRDQADVGREVTAQQRQQASQLIEAQLNVTQAQRAYQEALTQSSGAGSAALNKVAQAMKELSPAGREFVNFLFTEMKPALDQLKFTAQESLLPGVQQALENLKPLLPQINSLIATFGQALGQIAIQVVAALNGPSFRRFLDYLITEGPKILGYLTTIGLSLLDIFTTLIVAFGPSTDQILGGIASFTAGFAAFLEQFVQSAEFQQFMDYLLQNGPQIAALLLEIAIIALKLAIAFAPLGGIILQGLVNFFGFLAGLNPNTLLLIFSLIALAIGAIIIVVSGPVGIIVGIIAIGIAIAGLFAVVINLLPSIGNFFYGLWRDYLRPAAVAVVGFFTQTIPGLLSSAGATVSNFFAQLGGLVASLPNRLAVAGRGMFDWIGTSIKNALNNALFQWNRFAARFGFSMPALLGGGRLALPQLSYFAAGGIIPGYTPGRDTTLAALSGGEGIMRPEWVRAVGAGYVNTANAAARTGGISAVRALGLPRFATGGIYQPGGRTITASVGNGTPTGGAAQPLVGSIILQGAQATTRQDALLIADEIGWQARTGTGR